MDWPHNRKGSHEMSHSEQKDRVARLQRLMEEDGVGGMILTASKGMFYLSGFHEEQDTRFLTLFVPDRGDPVFLVPELNKEQVRCSTWVSEIVGWADGQDPYANLRSIVDGMGLAGSRLCIDEPMWSLFLLNIQERLPKARFVLGGQFMRVLRRVKSEAEKSTMMYLGSITDKVMAKTIACVRQGVTELQVAETIERGFRELGASPSGRTAVVGSGAFSAQPHYRATGKVIESGDSVVLDFGGIWQHYRSDTTRTVFVGKPDAEYRRIYDTVRKAMETTMEFIRPGVTCEAADRVARGIIADAGYGEFFIHRTGHGIGLEVHEDPDLVEGNSLLLEPGMAFSIEPGIYIPDRYGVRIEDCVIVTETGCEPFTRYSRDLVTIP